MKKKLLFLLLATKSFSSNHFEDLTNQPKMVQSIILKLNESNLKKVVTENDYEIIIKELDSEYTERYKDIDTRVPIIDFLKKDFETPFLKQYIFETNLVNKLCKEYWPTKSSYKFHKISESYDLSKKENFIFFLLSLNKIISISYFKKNRTEYSEQKSIDEITEKYYKDSISIAELYNSATNFKWIRYNITELFNYLSKDLDNFIFLLNELIKNGGYLDSILKINLKDLFEKKETNINDYFEKLIEKTNENTNDYKSRYFNLLAISCNSLPKSFKSLDLYKKYPEHFRKVGINPLNLLDLTNYKNNLS